MEIILKPLSSPVAFKIFDVPIYYYGITMLFAIVSGLIIANFVFKKIYPKNEAEKFFDIFAPLILFSIMGARLFYVIGAHNYYFSNPKEIIMINHGGLSIWGGVLVGILSLYFLCKKYKTDFVCYLDVLSLALPFSQFIGRWGNFFNQEAFGAPSNFFIKLFVDCKYRPEELNHVEYFHPTFLYEGVLDLVLFGILFVLYFKLPNLKKGTIFCLYLVFYSIIRIIVETIRIDSVAYVFCLPVAVVISIVVLVVSVCILFKLYVAKK